MSLMKGLIGLAAAVCLGLTATAVAEDEAGTTSSKTIRVGPTHVRIMTEGNVPPIQCMPAGPDPGASIFASPKMEKASFLGVSTSPATPALRDQLKLPRGVGLVVEQVEPESPAAAAGIKQHDVLHKLGDQLLINSQQLATLVRMNKAGDDVKLTLIREAQSKVVSAKLVEKELPVADAQDAWGLPPEMWRKMMPGGATLPAPGGVVTQIVGGAEDSQMIWADGEHHLTITGRGADKKLTVKAGDKLIFSGKIGTEEQRKAIPKEILPKLEQAEKTLQFELYFETPGPTSRPAIRFGTGIEPK